MNQGIQVSFDLPLAWTEQAVVSVIPQQEEGKASVALSISASGCLQNSLYKNMFVFGHQDTVMFKPATTWKQFLGRQNIKYKTYLESHDEVSICQEIKSLNYSVVTQITCTSTALSCVAIHLTCRALHPFTAPCVNRAPHTEPNRSLAKPAEVSLTQFWVQEKPPTTTCLHLMLDSD